MIDRVRITPCSIYTEGIYTKVRDITARVIVFPDAREITLERYDSIIER